MPWKAELDARYGIIVTTYSDSITPKDLADSAAAALALVQGDGPHRFLSEIPAGEPELSVVDLYEAPAQWDVLEADRRNKLALVVPEGSKRWRDAQFYETTCINRGWTVRLFATREPAIEWLNAS
jgi:hypothetical protein